MNRNECSWERVGRLKYYVNPTNGILIEGKEYAETIQVVNLFVYDAEHLSDISDEKL